MVMCSSSSTKYLEILYQLVLLAYKIGLKRIFSLWILGKPCIVLGKVPEVCNLSAIGGLTHLCQILHKLHN